MIYLDNAATTKPCEAAVNAALNAFSNFGNPSSLHKMGLDAEKIIKSSAKSISGLIGCNKNNIVFTSGGTESNNTAIFGTARLARNKHAVTTKIEHPSVLEPFRVLENEGWEIDYVNVDSNCRIDLSDLRSKLRKDTALVSVMHVNNETGTIQPIEKIREIIDEICPGAVFHVDAVQSAGKIDINAEKRKIDLLSLSGHKINGIKGCGALYINKRTEPLIVGGGQQGNKRSGTENVPGIAAFGAAAEYHMNNNGYDRIKELRKSLLNGLLSGISDTRYNGCATDYSPYVLNVSFLGIKSEILLHSLEAKGIFVSSGSACSSNKPMPSHVLSAMGCTNAEITSAIRFSFDSFTDADDINGIVTVIKEEVEKIRKYMR